MLSNESYNLFHRIPVDLIKLQLGQLLQQVEKQKNQIKMIKWKTGIGFIELTLASFLEYFFILENLLK